MVRLFLMCLFFISLNAYANEYFLNKSNRDLLNIDELSLEALLNFSITSALRKVEKLSEAPATALVITAQQIKERGYEYFEDLLRDIPGFDLVHVNGTYRTIFSQRGTFTGENNRSLILIDGIVESNILEGSLLHGGQLAQRIGLMVMQ